MKNLWISIGMALGLFAAPAIAMAQDGRTSIKDYAFQSKVKEFIDLSTYDPDAADANIQLLFRLKLGTELTAGTALKDVFFVGDAAAIAAALNPEAGASLRSATDGTTGLSEADEAGEQMQALFKTVTLTGKEAEAAERTQTAIPSSVLGKEEAGFMFLGKSMPGFAVSALGGLLFADGGTTDAAGLHTLNCPESKTWITYEKECLMVLPTQTIIDGDESSIAAPVKGDNAPVILAAGTDATGFFIWAQFDYKIDDARWLFQIRYYENGRTDYIVGNDLGKSAATAEKEFHFAPVAIQDSKSNGLIIGSGYGTADAHCWDVLKTQYVNYTYTAPKISTDCGPEIGRTISLFPPVNPAAFSLPTPPATTENTLSGQIELNPEKTAASLEAVNAFCVTITTTSYKDWGYYDLPKTNLPELGFKNNYTKVIYIGMPNDLANVAKLPLTAKDLTPNTEYYIHVYPYFYNASASLPYSYPEKAIISFGPYKTDLQAVENIQTTLSEGKVSLTFKPVDGMGTMVVKSANATPNTPSGKLELGNKLGDSQDEVMAIAATGATTAEFASDIKAGEGFYLHCYAVENAGTETARYSSAASTAVYRPVEKLPTVWNFTTDQVSPATASLPLLAPGWKHDETSTAEKAFKIGTVYNKNWSSVPGIIYSPSENELYTSVITPAFIADTNLVEATFNLYISSEQFQPGNLIGIEYRENGGSWKELQKVTEIPAFDESGFRTVSCIFSCTKGNAIEMRFSTRIAAYNSIGIASIQLKGSNPCASPTELNVKTNRTTDQQLMLTWLADRSAQSFVLAYQEAGTETPDAWTKLPVETKTAILKDLKANTAYHIQVQAVCDENAASDFSKPIVATTHFGLPYAESLGNEYNNPTNPNSYTTPAERGIKTYTGKIGGKLTEASNYETWQTSRSLSALTGDQKDKAIAVDENVSAGVFASPKIYTTEPTILKFTLNSFSLTKDADNNYELKAQGVAPTEADCRLYVAVSNDGEFTTEDVVLKLTGIELALADSTFELNVGKTGALQIAFFFDNPANHWDDAFFLEAHGLSLTAIPPVAVEYTLSLTASPAEGGTVTGAGKHLEGSDVTITATPNEGYDFVAWMDGATQLATSATYTFKMPAADASYTAVFKSNKPAEEHLLTLTASPANGGRVSGAGSYLADEEVTISAEANDGYVFVAWLSGTDTLSKEATYTFKMPENDTAFMARFIVKPVANENALRANFSLSTKDGSLYIRNLGGWTVKNVEVYGLTGNRIERFTPNSREDLILPVKAERAMLFVRIATEKGAAVYKVYVH